MAKQDQDILAQALRENLLKRKVQKRERVNMTQKDIIENDPTKDVPLLKQFKLGLHKK